MIMRISGSQSHFILWFKLLGLDYSYTYIVDICMLHILIILTFLFSGTKSYKSMFDGIL